MESLQLQWTLFPFSLTHWNVLELWYAHFSIILKVIKHLPQSPQISTWCTFFMLRKSQHRVLSFPWISQACASTCRHKDEIVINWDQMNRSFVGIKQWQDFTQNFGTKNLICQHLHRTGDADKIQIKESWALKYLHFLVMTANSGDIRRVGEEKRKWGRGVLIGKASPHSAGDELQLSTGTSYRN